MSAKKALLKPRKKKLAPEEVLIQVLEGLGSSSEEIFTFMIARGIKGRREYSTDCPVARFLKEDGYASSTVSVKKWVTKADALTVGTPPAVREFICDFDHNRYPSLVEKP